MVPLSDPFEESRREYEEERLKERSDKLKNQKLFRYNRYIPENVKRNLTHISTEKISVTKKEGFKIESRGSDYDYRLSSDNRAKNKAEKEYELQIREKAASLRADVVNELDKRIGTDENKLKTDKYGTGFLGLGGSVNVTNYKDTYSIYGMVEFYRFQGYRNPDEPLEKINLEENAKRMENAKKIIEKISKNKIVRTK